jgi:hypothetical protein
VSQRRPRSWQELRDQEIKWLIERTGVGLETWNARVRESGKTDQASLREWLSEKGVTGYPAMLLVMERFGYPDYLQTSAEDLIENQYADRPATRPIYDALLTLLPEVGEIEVQARKTYVAFLTPKRTFSALVPTTRTRSDLGLRLPATQPASGKLEVARNFPQSSLTHKIGLSSPDDIDDEVVGWLKRSHAENI